MSRQKDSMQKELWYLHQDIKGPCWCGWSLHHVGWCTTTWVHVGVCGAYYSWGQHMGLWPWSVLPPNVIGMLPPESYADAVNVHGLCCHTRPCWIWVACAEIWRYVMSVVCAAHWGNVDIHGLGAASVIHIGIHGLCYSEGHFDVLGLCCYWELWWYLCRLVHQRTVLMSEICPAPRDQAEVLGTCWCWSYVVRAVARYNMKVHYPCSFCL